MKEMKQNKADYEVPTINVVSLGESDVIMASDEPFFDNGSELGNLNDWKKGGDLW